MKRSAMLLVLGGLLAVGAPSRAQKKDKASAGSTGYTVSAGDVTDRRRNDGFFNRLEVDMVVAGDAPLVKGVRAIVTRAVDDTGRDLVAEPGKTPDFGSFNSSTADKGTFKIELKNPARKAAAVKEISGRLELLVPSRDPSSIAKIPGFKGKPDKPFVHPALKAAGVEITLMTKEGYEREKKAAEAQRKKDAEGNPLGGLAEAFGGMIESLMGGLGPNDVVLRIADKGKKIVSIDVADAAGKEISSGGMRTGDYRMLSFQESVPADAVLNVALQTPKAVVSLPFALKDVPLP